MLLGCSSLRKASCSSEERPFASPIISPFFPLLSSENAYFSAEHRNHFRLPVLFISPCSVLVLSSVPEPLFRGACSLDAPRSGMPRAPRKEHLRPGSICGVLLPASARTLDFWPTPQGACCVRSCKGGSGGTPEGSFRGRSFLPEKGGRKSRILSSQGSSPLPISREAPDRSCLFYFLIYNPCIRSIQISYL